MEWPQGILRMTAKNPSYPRGCESFCTRILIKALTSEINTRDRTAIAVKNGHTCQSFLLTILHHHLPLSRVFSMAEANIKICIIDAEQATLRVNMLSEDDGESRYTSIWNEFLSHDDKIKYLLIVHHNHRGLFITHGPCISSVSTGRVFPKPISYPAAG